MRVEGVTSPNIIPKTQPVSKEKYTNNNEFKNENISVTEEEKRKVTEDELINAIEKANKEFIIYDRKFEFSIHEETKEIVVRVIDANTDKVIREIPPEKILDMVAKMWELAGILVDERI